MHDSEGILMSVVLKQSADLFDGSMMGDAGHLLMILPPEQPANLPHAEVLQQRLARSRATYGDLGKTPVAADLPQGGLVAWLVLDPKLDAFQRHTLLRKAMKPLLDDHPETL